MKLAAWLRAENLSPGKFAGKYHLRRSRVHRHATGIRMPRPLEVAFYYQVTGGKVGPQDWYDLAKLRKELAARKRLPVGA